MKKMSDLKHTLYYFFIIFIWMWWAYYTSCSVEATYESLSRDPLQGSPKKWPVISNESECQGGGVYHHEELTRLMDVGATMSSNDSSISFVPPLDGASPLDTMLPDEYVMTLVLFDLQLVELKNVDPVGGSFRAELEMVLHWVEPIQNGSEGTPLNDECRFPCGTKSQTPLCCDKVWVPPLNFPRCEINKIESSTPTPTVFTTFRGELSFKDCFQGLCLWRRLWYLNIDVTCATEMDFHYFPFDVQLLDIDILNPYASRTWFQLTKGFLDTNVGESINTINLSPDAKIPGWYVKSFTVSGTCGTSKNWKQTFLTQDSLLKALNDTYVSQKDDIKEILDSEDLQCAIMEDLTNMTHDTDFLETGWFTLYKDVKTKYIERLNATLQTYNQCSKNKGEIYYWNLSSYEQAKLILIPNFGSFQTSSENIRRSFSILDLVKDRSSAHVSFPCAISAIANLTTPGLRVTIVVQRYQLYYVVKLLLPTVACVAFSFAAFGLHPKDLVGRLTVVVPSAIALTALQSLVVSTDIPPVAYIAPSTYIFLLAYLVQVIISFESIFVSWLSSQSCDWMERDCLRRTKRVPFAPTMNNVSSEPYKRYTSEDFRKGKIKAQDVAPAHEMLIEFSSTRTISQESIEKEDSGLDPLQTDDMSNVVGHKTSNWLHKMDTRTIDLLIMVLIGLFYIGAIFFCTIYPRDISKLSQNESSNLNVVQLWPKS